MSLSANISEKASLIWAIADKLTGVYKPHEYGEVILPLTVIRRFDCILSDTKDAVLEKYENIKKLPLRDVLLRKASNQPFYNTSKFTFERLLDDPDNIESNFRDYLNGFSDNVQDIIEKFKFDVHINTMANKGILYIVLKEFTTQKANLHPSVISNLEMGYIFEEIIRKFSESHNEDAGQHYTPREVIKLMVNILFYDDNDILSGNNVAKTIDIGLQNVEVSKIVGICDGRVDEYNDDFTPIDSNDPRWLKVYNGYKNGDSLPPIPLILAPDNNYYGDGDGSHRISAAKVLNMQTVSAKVTKMVEKEKGINDSWQEYAKDRIEKLNKMSKEYQGMWPKFYELQDKAFESGDHKEYNKFKKQMNDLGNEISKLDRELLNEEKDYKNNLLGG